MVEEKKMSSAFCLICPVIKAVYIYLVRLYKFNLKTTPIEPILVVGEYHFDSGQFGFDFGNIGALDYCIVLNIKKTPILGAILQLIYQVRFDVDVYGSVPGEGPAPLFVAA